jgi:undecaprenyl-diphosphatase
LWCGLQRETAARFSFLMAIPAILGAMLLKIGTLSTLPEEQIGLLVGGMVSALVVGYIALRFLLRLLMQGNLCRFAIYCWLLGVAAILLSLSL